jgi:hypothetical protein
MATKSWWGGLLGSLAMVLFCLPGAGAAEASAAKARPQAYFIAGVDVPVDVTLDGEPVASLQSKDVHGPVDVVAGEHTVEFTAAGWTAKATVRLEGRSVDVVVHRPADASADPVVTVFPNDVTPIEADRARLTVAHTAVVPPADVRVAGKVLFADIANGEFVTAEVPADTYSVDIVPTGGSTPLLGPLDLTVKAGALNRVFAIGQPENGSMDAIVQVLPLRTTSVHPPSDVRAGEAGLVAPGRAEPGRNRSTYAWLGLGAAGLAALVVIAQLAHQRRSHAPT